MELVLVVLAYSAAAAAISAVGVLPLIGRESVPRSWLGWSNAAAAGMMLAGAFALFGAGVANAPLSFGMGAFGGIAFVAWTHQVAGTGDLDLNRIDETGPEYGYEVLLVSSLHSAVEGIAIGGAMAAAPSLGAFMALAMAVHNVPEATLLAAVFRSRGVTSGRAALLAVISNLGQVLMAVATYAVVVAAPAGLPWALGTAAGALIYLVMVDLLPESYREAGTVSIAMVAIVSMGAFALLRGWIA